MRFCSTLKALFLFALPFFAFLIGSFCTYALDTEELYNPPQIVLLYGDSLMSGYGLKPKDTFESQLLTALEEEGYKVEIINSAVAGDTTARGVERMDTSLPERPRPDVVLLCLGGNDLLKRIPHQETRANLDEMVKNFVYRGYPVVLAGIRPPGTVIVDDFHKFFLAYEEIAEKYDVHYVPDMIDGVTGSPDKQQQDIIHPNAKGVAQMVENVMPALTRALDGNSPAAWWWPF